MRAISSTQVSVPRIKAADLIGGAYTMSKLDHDPGNQDLRYSDVLPD